MAKIIKISHNSPALHKLKIGDDVISFNDRNFVDVLDYIYADSLETVEITFYRNEQKESVTIVKNQYESLGIDFDSSVEIVPMECYNNCIFCQPVFGLVHDDLVVIVHLSTLTIPFKRYCCKALRCCFNELQ